MPAQSKYYFIEIGEHHVYCGTAGDVPVIESKKHFGMTPLSSSSTKPRLFDESDRKYSYDVLACNNLRETFLFRHARIVSIEAESKTAALQLYQKECQDKYFSKYTKKSE